MKSTHYSLTNPQKSILDIEQYYKKTSYGNLAVTIYVDALLDYRALVQAINILLENNEALRLKLTNINNEIKQYVSDYIPYSLYEMDIRNVQGLSTFQDWEIEQATTPFNLMNSELFYFALIHFGEKKSALFIKLHHLISDAWTITLLVSDVLDYYKKIVSKTVFTPIVKPSYIEYIKEDTGMNFTDKLKKSKEFWQEIFRTPPQFTGYTLPGRFKGNLAGNRKTYTLSLDLTNKIKKFIKDKQITGFILFYAILALYISKVEVVDDLVIGTPVLNRANVKQKATLGMFITNIPFRITIDSNRDFLYFINHIKKEWRGILKHHAYPYHLILKDYKEKFNLSGPLFNVTLSYQNAVYNIDQFRYQSKWHFNGCEINALAIHVSDHEAQGKYQIDYDFSVETFTDGEISSLHEHLMNLMKFTLFEPTCLLRDMQILSNEEKYRILRGFNETKYKYPSQKTIHELFQEQVERTPDAVAIICEEKEITYRELNTRSNQLAKILMEKGIERDSIIGIIVKRSIEMIVGMIAVLKAGGAYLPIDPSFPEERIEYILKDSKTNLILTQEDVLISSNLKRINIDQFDNTKLIENNLDNINSPSDLAYVIYTSGSTGNPKGVMIEHRSVVNFIFGTLKKLDFTCDKTIISMTTISFDVFVMESLLPLTQGLHIVIATENEQKTPRYFSNLMNRYHVQMLQITPSRLQALMRDPACLKCLSQLTELFIGGEQLSEILLKKLKTITKAKIFNLYGPTETTIWSTIKEITDDEKVTIGRPLANTQVYILGQDLAPLPIGLTGELFIGGDGLARGYINRMDLMNQRFIPNPFIPRETIYRTGDLARWNQEGEIEFIGRNDNQVKIRGYRIELEEIEKCILSIQRIKEVVVIVRESQLNDKYLCAYLVGNRCSHIELRNSLSKILPDYMIPTKFIWLESLPLTPNGKLNRNELPLIDDEYLINDSQKHYSPPRNKIDEKLIEIWTKVLELEQIGIDDDFFALGGDSLNIIEILTALIGTYWEISAQDFYDYPSIRQISDKLVGNSKNKNEINPIAIDDLMVINEEIKKSFGFIETSNKVIKNVLLTGATGYLGIHILWELYLHTEASIYCLIRGEKGKQKLFNLLHFYFPYGNEFDAKLFKRIKIINGDLAFTKMGLSDSIYNMLGSQIDTVIHSAAVVRHYGLRTDFNQINVLGTQEMIKFCQQFNKQLNYISTMSISGSKIIDSKLYSSDSFKEMNFYFGQNYMDNLYIWSKFEAEHIIFRAVQDNLKANIFRIGNLTGRFSDGHFQKNIQDNAFYNKLKTIIELGNVFKNLVNQDLEFTPVDFCARAIFEIIKKNDNKLCVYHLFNHKKISLKELIWMLTVLGIKIDVLEDENYKNCIKDFAANNKSDVLKGLVLNQWDQLIEWDSLFTQNTLNRLGFKWPVITFEYMEKVISYMKNVAFIGDNENNLSILNSN